MSKWKPPSGCLSLSDQTCLNFSHRVSSEGIYNFLLLCPFPLVLEEFCRKNYHNVYILKHCPYCVGVILDLFSQCHLSWMNRRQSLFPSAFLVFFSTRWHLPYLVMGEQGVSLLFGSTMFPPCSKESGDPYAIVDTHVMPVWWDLLFSPAHLKISLSFPSLSPLSPVVPQFWLSPLSCHFVFGG